MKKWIVCFTCGALLAGAGVASAQVTGGVKGGVNFANMSFSGGGGGGGSPGNRTAWMAGGFVEIPIAKHLVIQPEALFTMKGTEYSGDFAGTGGTGVATTKLNYFDMPVLLRVDVPTTGTVAPFVYAGPNFGFLLSAKATATAAGTQQEEDIKSDLKSTDVGIAFGGGLRFGKVMAEVRYIYGLTNVIGATASAGGATAKNRVIKVIAGVRF